MLLIDFSGTLYASILGHLYTNNFELDEDLVRHVILNSIRKHKKKFSSYGNPIIACDSKNYWRGKLFPYYKAGRKEKQEADIKVDWKKVHGMMRKIKEELKLVLPYIFLEVESAEADDIIGYLASRASEKVMILSRDHDLIQIQKNSLVSQYNTIEDRFESTDNVSKFLFEHICKGDRGDGIPNIASPENSFAVGTRQKPVSQKNMDKWFSEKSIPEEYRARFSLNRKLVDLSAIPDDIKNKIEESYQAQINKKVEKRFLMTYLVDHGLDELSFLVGDFF